MLSVRGRGTVVWSRSKVIDTKHTKHTNSMGGQSGKKGEKKGRDEEKESTRFTMKRAVISRDHIYKTME